MKKLFNNINVTQGMIVGIGELLWDKLPEGDKIGGAPGNFAYHVAQLGLPSCIISAIGNDTDGIKMIDTIENIGLKSMISIVDFPTGSVDVTMSGNGIPNYEIHRNVAWDNIPFCDHTAEIARNTIAVCFGSLAQRSQTSRDTITRFIDSMPCNENTLKIFDINLRQDFYTKEIIDHSMSLCNILKINDQELELITEMFQIPGEDFTENCRDLLTRYQLRMLILTCGENGSYVFTPDGKSSFLPTPKVIVADTVGAGDSFTAAFIASLLQGKSIAEAHKTAVNISAYVCTQHGAMPQLPN